VLSLIKTLFFNDVDYYAEDFLKPFKSMTGNGVLSSSDLLVTAANPNNLSIDVASGKAFIEGHYIELDITTNIPITANTSGYNRIDTLCLKLDKNTKQSILTVIQGTPSSTPVAPTIPTEDGIYYLTLADVVVGNNSSTVTNVNITDKRVYKKVLLSNERIVTGDIDAYGSGSILTMIAPATGSSVFGNMYKGDRQIMYWGNGMSTNDDIEFVVENGKLSIVSKTSIVQLRSYDSDGNSKKAVVLGATSFSPDTGYDNKISLGNGGGRYSQLFSVSGTINTSDRNQKQQIGAIPDVVLNAWSEVNYTQFKFNDAVLDKGDNARWHIGLIAQEIEEAFIRHGIDAFEYGLLCRDLKEDGTYIYSIRPDECQFLEMALVRRELNKLKGL